MFVNSLKKLIPMKTNYNWIGVLFVIGLLGFISCNNNDDLELIDSYYKNLQLSCGSDLEIPVQAANWDIESVQYLPSNEVVVDKDGNPLILSDYGAVEASGGWLYLSRNGDDKFTLSLKENFDKSAERKFVICVNNGNHKEYISITQRAGTAYKLVKSEFKEQADQRKVYTSNGACTELTLNNNTLEPAWMPCGVIFEMVVESSSFYSDDYGAFDWIGEEELMVSVPELFVENTIRWNNRSVYKKGLTTIPFIKDIEKNNKILVQPYTTVHLKGRITYCKRVYNYTFTIQNEDTGTLFDINGVWTQVVPISREIIIS